jgi:hypothetical protein
MKTTPRACPGTLARWRAQRRKQSGGSVMFVIATTLALMASMGVYALASAGEELKVSGYMRQSAQAHYLTEMSMTSTSSFMDSNADAVIRQAKGDLNQGGLDYRTKNCQSAVPPAAGVSDIAQACKRFTSAELTGTWKKGGSATPEPMLPMFRPGGLTTGLGANQQAQFWAELTNFVPLAPPPGFDVNFRMKFVKATITTGGILVTSVSTTDPNTNNVTTSTVGRTPEMGRGRVVVGPFLN